MRSKDTFAWGCLSQAILLGVLAVIGGISVDYLLDYFLQTDIPFIADMGIGLVCGETAVPVAIVVWILVSCGVL